MSDSEEDLLKTGLYVGGAYAVYQVAIKPLLAYFGANPEQQASISKVDNQLPTENPFNAQFQPFVDGVTAALSGGPYDGDIPAYMTFLKQVYSDSGGEIEGVGPGDGMSDLGFEANLAESIYSAFKWYKLAADFDNVMSAFNQVNSQVEVAAIAAYLQVNYNVDLWTFLKNGAWGSFRGMHAPDLAVISDRVYSLPVQ